MKIYKYLINSVIAVLISIFIGTLLLTSVYSIDTSQLADNITSSAATIQNEGVYPQLSKYATSNLDNSTDSLMLNTAGYNGYYSAIIEAMKAHRYCYSYQLPDKELINHYILDIPCDFVD